MSAYFSVIFLKNKKVRLSLFAVQLSSLFLFLSSILPRFDLHNPFVLSERSPRSRSITMPLRAVLRTSMMMTMMLLLLLLLLPSLVASVTFEFTETDELLGFFVDDDDHDPIADHDDLEGSGNSNNNNNNSHECQTISK